MISSTNRKGKIGNNHYKKWSCNNYDDNDCYNNNNNTHKTGNYNRTTTIMIMTTIDYYHYDNKTTTTLPEKHYNYKMTMIWWDDYKQLTRQLWVNYDTAKDKQNTNTAMMGLE